MIFFNIFNFFTGIIPWTVGFIVFANISYGRIYTVMQYEDIDKNVVTDNIS
jgi:hypothetical protein